MTYNTTVAWASRTVLTHVGHQAHVTHEPPDPQDSQICPKTPPRRTKTPPIRPQYAPRRPKTPRRRPKTPAQDTLSLPETWFSFGITPFGKLWLCVIEPPKTSPKSLQNAPRRPKDGPIRPKDGPVWLQDGILGATPTGMFGVGRHLVPSWLSWTPGQAECAQRLNSIDGPSSDRS
jgi:hypothetical protein